MSRLTDTVRGLMTRFGISAPAANGLEVIKRVLSAEEFETVATAIQLGSERLQAVEMVDALFAGRRNDDRTNLIEEVAFKGGWRRDPGDLPSEMYLNYVVVIMEPTDDSLDAQRVPAKGRRVLAPDGSTVFVPTNAAGKIDLAVDPHTKKNVDFFVHMFKADADAAGLELVHNVGENRYEFPVVKCRLKKHFMFACQVLVFDKEACLAWQGAHRRGQITRQDAEKMYSRLNWLGPQKRSDLAGLYVLMLHNNINHYADWPQWRDLTLGGETFGVNNARYHTYGTTPTRNESPQWAVLNHIIRHGVDTFNREGINTVLGQSVPWTASQFFEFTKDDLVFHAYDHADNAALEKIYLDVAEGDVTILDADNLIKMTGKTTGIYSHRPRDVRDDVVRQLHLAVSEAARAEIQRSFDRETITRQDLYKFYDPDRGAWHRFKDIQDERRNADLDLLDGIMLRWFTHPNLGLVSIGEATRTTTGAWIKEGFGRHRKEISLWGNRVSWMDLLRFADDQEVKVLFDLLQSAAGGRILAPGTVSAVLRWFGKGYDPHPDCAGHWEGEGERRHWVFHYRGDGHRHTMNHVCEARKQYKMDRGWEDEPLDRWMARVVAMRVCEIILMSWLNKIFDNKKFNLRWEALMPEGVGTKEKDDARFKLIQSGSGHPFFTLDYPQYARFASGLAKVEDGVEAEFTQIIDVLAVSVEEVDIRTTLEAARDVWYEMCVYMCTKCLMVREVDDGVRGQYQDAREGLYQSYRGSRAGQYLERYKKPF